VSSPRRTHWLPLLIALAAVAAWTAWQRAHDTGPAGAATVSETAAAPWAATEPPARPTPAAREDDAPSVAARRDLSADEARGGHTLARHVGRSDADLRDRLRRESGISAASTYSDRPSAERVVAAAIAQQDARVQAWARRSGNRPNLAVDYRGRRGDVIGRSLRRGQATPVDCTDALVVLRWRGDGFFVLTSYPEERR
jgi:hypothetical protein